MKARLAIATLVLACIFHAPSASADEAATIAQLQSMVVELDQAYANEEVLHGYVQGGGSAAACLRQ